MASPLKKQDTGVSQAESEKSTAVSIPITENVIVLEKEFKTKKSHKAQINCLTKISDTEFMSCSDDMSFKIWDKDLQGCSYTYETHETLSVMRLTGQKKNLLISSLGAGNLIIMGLEQRNQHDIIEAAHDDRICQIVSLGGSKLEDKYFATRCIDGDVSIWSATSHPDRVFTIENVDQDETAPAQVESAREQAKEEEAPPKVEEEAEPEEGAEEGEEEVDEDGNPIPKKKPEPKVVKKDKSGRISSDRDCMLEIKWNQSVL